MSDEWKIPAELGWEVDGTLYRNHPEATAAVQRIRKATGKRPALVGPRALPDGWVMVGDGAWVGWPAPRSILDAQGHVPSGINPEIDTGAGGLPLRRELPASTSTTPAAVQAPQAPPVPAGPSPELERITAALDLRRREVEAMERSAAAAERQAAAVESFTLAAMGRLELLGVTSSNAARPEVSPDQAPEVSPDQAGTVDASEEVG